ncbi:MAG: MaoC/PaaZ C-terminal domain-containing protein [Pirellulaceae bacterium]|nr:MaoC/PaaZ C-terminal domain-containing protein [Pirellulaceae bacterium]
MTQIHYLENLSVGGCWFSEERVVTEADVHQFAEMTGDFDPLHIDPEFARTTPFGRQIAHGLLGLSFLAGLSSQAPRVSTVAFVRIDQWRFVKPIFLGDTVRVETRVVDLQNHGRKYGQVTWKRRLLNQNDEVVQEGLFVTIVNRESRQVFECDTTVSAAVSAPVRRAA